jgi:hypothetical protein
VRRQWLTGRACFFHLTVAVLVPVCIWAGWWQYHVAMSGNTLSWAYTFEWPCFAVIAVVAWWHLIHEDPAQRDERARRADLEDRISMRAEDTDRDSDDLVVSSDLAARVAAAARQEYESHLARLAEMDRATSWRSTTSPP